MLLYTPIELYHILKSIRDRIFILHDKSVVVGVDGLPYMKWFKPPVPYTYEKYDELIKKLDTSF